MPVPFTISEPYVVNGESLVTVDDGTTKWNLLPEMAKDLPNIYNLDVRPDDVWLTGYPKSGNSWIAEALYTVYLGLEKANEKLHFERTCFPEFRAIQVAGVSNMPEEKRKNVNIRDTVQHAIDLESPRIVRCHLPLILLPPKLLDTCKVIYVCRDVKDVVVSFFKMLEGTGSMGGGEDMEPFADNFLTEKGLWHPLSEHIKQAWEKRHHPNLYFLHYEDMKKDLPGVLHKFAAFVGKSLTDEQVKELEDYLSVESMRKNKNIDFHEQGKQVGLVGETVHFIRKGAVGDWKNHFTPSMKEKFETWINQKFAGTDFKYQE